MIEELTKEQIIYGTARAGECYGFRWKQIYSGHIANYERPPIWPKRYTRKQRKLATAKWLDSKAGRDWKFIKLIEQKIKAAEQRLLANMWQDRINGFL